MKPRLALLILLAAAFSAAGQTKPATVPNTSGLFQPPAPKAVVPTPAVKPATPAATGARVRAATPAEINAVKAQLAKPMVFSSDTPYERCQTTINSLKKIIPSLTQQVLADRLVAGYADGQASYQYTCTRAGKMTSSRTPNGMTVPVAAPTAAPAATPNKPGAPAASR